jgi:hypothetical protein
MNLNPNLKDIPQILPAVKFSKLLLQKKGTGNREKTKVAEFKAQSKKGCFLSGECDEKNSAEPEPLRLRSLFQSHVFKHEFFLFPVARSLFPLNFVRNPGLTTTSLVSFLMSKSTKPAQA